MPFIIRDVSYDLPGDDGRTGPTGAEIDVVETYFGVDYFDLMNTLKPAKGARKAAPGCSRTRAFYAMAWIVMHRQDKAITLASVMAEYGHDELRYVADAPTPGEVAAQAALPTPAGDEETEPAATS